MVRWWRRGQLRRAEVENVAVKLWISAQQARRWRKRLFRRWRRGDVRWRGDDGGPSALFCAPPAGIMPSHPDVSLSPYSLHPPSILPTAETILRHQGTRCMVAKQKPALLMLSDGVLDDSCGEQHENGA